MSHQIERLEDPAAAAAWIKQRRKTGLCVGFVPTMGALHAGHISLVKRARSENDLVIVSVFVNPLQFDEAKDLAAYPRDIDGDVAMLEEAGCDLVFTGSLCGPGGFFPECESPGAIRLIEAGPAAEGLEAEMRTGHFEGVATIVRRLFETVRPQRTYFGAKDRQQTLVVQHLIECMNREHPGSAPVLTVCPIAREASGLARSSRNELLDPWTRWSARLLHQTLRAGAMLWSQGERNAERLLDELRRAFDQAAPVAFELEYLALRDPASWGPDDPSGTLTRAAVLIAVRVPGADGGSVRLIDNLDLSIGAATLGLSPWGRSTRAEVHCLAPAKINPQLGVLGRLSDGFHEVDLSMLAVDLVDGVFVGWVDDGVVRDTTALVEAIELTLAGSAVSDEIPLDRSNLAVQGVEVVLDQITGPLPAGRVVVHLDKSIPSRAGLGGGSSDAVAAMLGTLELVRQLDIELSAPPSSAYYLQRAAELGSDCAFFMEGTGFARCLGRGERVTYLDPSLHADASFVIATPAVECSTKQIFEAFGAVSTRATDQSSFKSTAWYNQLEPVALRVTPELGRFRSVLDQLGGDWQMAGSGSSFFQIDAGRMSPQGLGDLSARFHHHAPGQSLRYLGAHRAFGSGARVVAAFVREPASLELHQVRLLGPSPETATRSPC